MIEQLSLRWRRVFPNMFTFGNMLCGFLSVIEAYNHEYIFAAWLIIIAAVCDSLDGIAARLTKSSSQFGIQLDSIADVVSFGFAPAFLIYSVQLKDYALLGALAASIFLLAGGFRLARFNSELVGFSKQYFNGLPIPAGAITLVSYVLLFLDGRQIPVTLELYTFLLVIGVAILMASHVKYDTLPNPNWNEIKQKPFMSGFVGLAIPVVIFSGGRALFYVFLVFIVFGIFKYVKKIIFEG